MSFYLLFVIFVGFTAAALQYSVLGSVWPLVYEDFGVALSVVGYVNMILAVGRIAASLSSDRLVKKFGTFKVGAFGFSLICFALFGYANSHSFWMLCLSSVPLGFGEDLFLTSMNAFSAVNLKASHASWMNMVWSLGATVGPYIMSFCMGKGYEWNTGYLVLTAIQFCVLVFFLSSGSKWKELAFTGIASEEEKKRPREKTWHLKYMPVMTIAFFAYMAIENTSALWGSSYMILNRGLSDRAGALAPTFLFLGMTVGRFLSGFVSDRLGDKRMMHIGQVLIVAGGLGLAAGTGEKLLLVSMLLLGLGCAPIFPCFIHYIPQIFGTERSGAAIGLLLGGSQVATILFPVVFGWVADLGGMWLYPFFQMFFALLMMVMLIWQKKSAEKG